MGCLAIIISSKGKAILAYLLFILGRENFNPFVAIIAYSIFFLLHLEFGKYKRRER